MRSKDGVELRLGLYTTTSPVRQQIQAVMKANLEDIGFRIDIENVDSAIFFDSAAGNEQNNTHFYTDTNEFASGVGAPPPVSYMIRWYAGPNRENIAQRSNQWQGQNYQRWVSEEFDALYESLIVQTDPEAAADILIQMNDLLIEEVVVIPQVNRGSVFAIANSINEENIAAGPGFELSFWNIANWNRLPG